jgi:DNA invertase Pin-like site-specific DNA recombinase
MRAAAIYCRISKDDTGDRLGVRRQERDCRALAKRRGWAVGRVYVDDDVSAYHPGGRPEYARMLRDLKAGVVDGVVVYDLDRLHRHPWELEEFFRICDAAQISALASVASDVDLGTHDGQLYARLMGAVARKESDDKARRLRRKHQELAERGRWSGGPRPYGYRALGDGRLEIVPAEATVIREAARRVLAGESPYAICSDLNAREVPTARGGPWRTPTLRRILTASLVAGFREHRGEVVGRAAWEAVLDEVTWRRLVAHICDPSRSRDRPVRSFLLTGGMSRCGSCGGRLVAGIRESGARIYRCVRSPDVGGCGRLQINADPFEACVVEDVMQAVDTDHLAEMLVEDDGARAGEAAEELADVERRLDELTDMYSVGEIDRRGLLRARSRLERRQEAARAAMSRQRRTVALDSYTGRRGALREAWPDLGFGEKRAVLEAVIDRVTVARAARRGPRFDRGRVKITWRA